MDPRILVVSEDCSLPSLIHKKLGYHQPNGVDSAANLHEIKQILSGTDAHIFAAVLDIQTIWRSYPQIIAHLNAVGIPSIVLTPNLDERFRETLRSQKVNNSFIRDDDRELDIAVQVLQQMRSGHLHQILLVDGDDRSRTELADVLRRYNYQVIEESKGISAIQTWMKGPEIKLIIANLDLIDISAPEFVRKIRCHAGKDTLSILGLCSNLSPHERGILLRSGVNDLLDRPFDLEVFSSQVEQEIEMVHLFRKIKENSHLDYLTHLFNRRYLFNMGTRFFQRVKREGRPMAVAMIDADHFHSINERFGRSAGDRTLKRLAEVLGASFRPADLVTRFGGEVFCVVMTGIQPEDAFRRLEKVRQTIEDLEFEENGDPFRLTISVGIVTELGSSLQEMVRRADEVLHQAKAGGRNRVNEEERGRDLPVESPRPRKKRSGIPSGLTFRALFGRPSPAKSASN